MGNMKRSGLRRFVLIIGCLCLLTNMNVEAQEQPISQELLINKEYFYDVNANYLGMAYDLVYLNLDNYTEPAFPKPEFDIPPVVFALKRGPQTIKAINGKTFHLPTGVKGYPGDTGSRFESELEEYSSGNSYRKSMEITLNLSGGIKGVVSSSRSASFKKVEQVTKNSKSRMWRQKGYVQGHRLQIDLSNPGDLTFTQDFKLDVSGLDSQESYDAFIQEWGTHFSSKITYGGKAYLTAIFSQEDFERSKMKKEEFSQAVSGTFRQVTASVSGRLSTESEKTSKSSMIHEKITASAFGGNGSVFSRDVPGSFNDWAATVRENPGIYATELTSYDIILISSFFPKDSQIKDKQKKMRSTIENYLRANNVDAPESGNFYPSTPTVTTLNGEYRLQQKLNQRYADAYGESRHDYRLVTRSFQNNDSQIWIIKPVESEQDTYRIQQKINQRYVDAYHKSNDYDLVTRSWQNNDSQKWIIKETK